MKIDFIEALAALDHYNVRVVRAKYVDSAEDAIAFAARRDARDTRAVPIVLMLPARKLSGLAIPASDAGPLRDEHAIRNAYKFWSTVAEPFGDRVLAREEITAGTDLTITGRTDNDSRKYLDLSGGASGIEQLVPLAEAGAEILATHVLAHDHRGATEKQRRMLEHLVLRVSALFERPELYAITVGPVRLHENGYTVLGATMEASSRLHIEKRLDRHAHDRKEYGFRPAGRQ